jgi:hypothetical protein
MLGRLKKSWTGDRYWFGREDSMAFCALKLARKVSMSMFGVDLVGAAVLPP